MSDLSSDVCSSDLGAARHAGPPVIPAANFLAVPLFSAIAIAPLIWLGYRHRFQPAFHKRYMLMTMVPFIAPGSGRLLFLPGIMALAGVPTLFALAVGARDLATAGSIHRAARSEEHTSEIKSLMRISYAAFCLKKNNTEHQRTIA